MAVGSGQSTLLKGHEHHGPCIQGSQNQSVLGIEVTRIVFVYLGTEFSLCIPNLLGTFHVD